MKTLHFQSVFVGGCGTAAGPMEAQGPLKDKIDKLFDDIYCEEKTYEQAERRLMSEACDHALRAQGCKTSDLDLILGGDLLNQLGTSTISRAILIFRLSVCMAPVPIPR